MRARTSASGVFVAFDFDGTPRPLDGNGADGPALDLGAYEFLLATADSNGDGIPDGWCQRFGFSPVAGNVANDDTDLDGASNSGEYVADTNPTNALSYFHIRSIADAPLATVIFASSTNRQYTLSIARTWAAEFGRVFRTSRTFVPPARNNGVDGYQRRAGEILSRRCERAVRIVQT